jgi:transcriptional regulator with XRE-family HTH domain
MTKPPTKAKTKTARGGSGVPASPLRGVLSTNVRMSRAALRMTQRDLAVASGISQKHISLLESPEGANIGIDLVDALARGLGVSAADLLTPPPRRTN